ncbi:NYN domain-containing protein [Brachybacterium subflavum]|uniref:NYN domain-containing protein n=1 Tax=Brachybacterium subflavum TaxID=2585206 RepID=UPI001266881E|nr:NYN domain-containing protein [Brachybacterium subflavum]
MDERSSYLLVDGENIDATLGLSVLGRRPHPEERPRWNTLLSFIQEHWSEPTHGLFFLAVASDLPASFVQALLAMGYTPIPLRGDGKVVDIAIQRTLTALKDRASDVALVSHDRDFVDQMRALSEDEERRLAIVGFREFMASDLRQVPRVEILDLEFDAGTFTSPLPRVRVIEIDEFDPYEFI